MSDPYNPPRRPLRVRVSARGELGDGTSLVARGWRILDPDEAEYEQVYRQAAHVYRTYGWPMPYADASSDEEEGRKAGERTPVTAAPCAPLSHRRAHRCSALPMRAQRE